MVGVAVLGEEVDQADFGIDQRPDVIDGDEGFEERQYRGQGSVPLVTEEGCDVYPVTELVSERYDRVVEQDDVLSVAVPDYSQILYVGIPLSHTALPVEDGVYLLSSRIHQLQQSVRVGLLSGREDLRWPFDSTTIS